MPAGELKFLNILHHPFRSKLFLLTRLPSAFFCGIRVKYADPEKAIVTVPYNWFSKNPFRSTYFACLAMGAEMSTGVLAMAHVHEQSPAVSILVKKIEGNFMKKATGVTSFTCEDGDLIRQAVRECLSSGKSSIADTRSSGKNNKGETVAEFTISWSFKVVSASA